MTLFWPFRLTPVTDKKTILPYNTPEERDTGSETIHGPFRQRPVPIIPEEFTQTVADISREMFTHVLGQLTIR